MEQTLSFIYFTFIFRAKRSKYRGESHNVEGDIKLYSVKQNIELHSMEPRIESCAVEQGIESRAVEQGIGSHGMEPSRLYNISHQVV